MKGQPLPKKSRNLYSFFSKIETTIVDGFIEAQPSILTNQIPPILSPKIEHPSSQDLNCSHLQPLNEIQEKESNYMNILLIYDMRLEWHI